MRLLKEMGIRTVMVTGDNERTAQAIGAQAGVDRVIASVLPEGKADVIKSLGTEGKTMMVGDGINDAPVLSRSDVGIAMGGMGSDAAIEAADIVIMDDDLAKIPRVISLGRRTVRIATQNIAFALGVKILVLLLSAFGFANMWAAVFADVGVTVICIVNAMRLLKRS